MNKKIVVVVERFGKISLRKEFGVDEITGQTVEQIVRNVVNHPPEGSNEVYQRSLMRRLNAIGGFFTSINSSQDKRVFFPVRKENQIKDYLDERYLKENQQNAVLHIELTSATEFY